MRAKLEAIHADLLEMKRDLKFHPERRIEPYTVLEFAALIRRHREWVSERCRAGIIKTLPGKPYRIPVSQLILYLKM